MASERDRLQALERLRWEQDFQREERDKADREQYRKQYLIQMRDSLTEPLSFEAWRRFIPEEHKDSDPKLRGAVATSRCLWKKTVSVSREAVQSRRLEDEDLAELGFDLRERVEVVDVQLSVIEITSAFRMWVPTEPRWDHGTHYPVLVDFLIRNHLRPTPHNVSLTFSLLWNMCVFDPVPGPEPPDDPEVAEAEPVDPEEAKRLAWGKYTTEVVATDPETGETFTQYQVDRCLSADQFKRIVMKGRTALVTDLIDPLWLRR